MNWEILKTVLASSCTTYKKFLQLDRVHLRELVQYEKNKESKVGDWSYRNIYSSIKKSCMEGLLIMNCFDWHSRFFDLSSFGGFQNFRDEGTSRWAILPPSDLLSFIDFLFHHSQINFFQFSEILWCRYFNLMKNAPW